MFLVNILFQKFPLRYQMEQVRKLWPGKDINKDYPSVIT